MHIKKGDTVIVTVGSQKGVQGEVVSCLPKEDKVIVKGVNIATMHKKPKVRGEKGSIVKTENLFIFLM